MLITRTFRLEGQTFQVVGCSDCSKEIVTLKKDPKEGQKPWCKRENNFCKHYTVLDSEASLEPKKPQNTPPVYRVDHVIGVSDITAKLRETYPTVLSGLSEKTVDRYLDKPGPVKRHPNKFITCEQTGENKFAYIHVNSFDNYMGPDCDLKGLKQIASHTPWSLRKVEQNVEQLVENGLIDKFCGRYYSTTTSLDAFFCKSPSNPGFENIEDVE